MRDSGITVCIPSIPPRAHLLDRARRSVDHQTLQPERVIVCLDHERRGAAATRQQALEQVTTEFVAFLDDDDELFPRHLELLQGEILSSGADLVYPWFEVEGGYDPFPSRFGQPFDPTALRERQYVPITVLARTQTVLDAGGFSDHTNALGWTQEDWFCWLSMLDNGAQFVHLPRRTWTWYHWYGNTSGNPRNW